MSGDDSILERGRAVFQIESEAVAAVGARLDVRFETAVQMLHQCRGRVVVTGIGKSGAIGRKVASTFASTGTPAFFLHAAEGVHGDLGMVSPGDILVAISYTGRTDEFTSILPVVREMGVPIIAVTGNERAYLAAHADIVLDIGVDREACPLNLAPTSSTTAALAMGDALAIGTMLQRGFSHDKFARFHPGGTLGKASTIRVAELLRSGTRLACLAQTATVRDVLKAITEAQAGSAVLVDGAGQLAGYLTDGDVRRRLLDSDDARKMLQMAGGEIMTRNPLAFSPDSMAIDALRALQERGVDDAPVVDEANRPVGVLDVQDLLRAGLM